MWDFGGIFWNRIRTRQLKFLVPEASTAKQQQRWYNTSDSGMSVFRNRGEPGIAGSVIAQAHSRVVRLGGALAIDLSFHQRGIMTIQYQWRYAVSIVIHQ